MLSYDPLGVQSLLSIVRGNDTVIIGEGVDIFVQAVPRSLAGQNLGESQIGARTGLNVIAVQSQDGVATTPGADTELDSTGELVMLGTPAQAREVRAGVRQLAPEEPRQEQRRGDRRAHLEEGRDEGSRARSTSPRADRRGRS